MTRSPFRLPPPQQQRQQLSHRIVGDCAARMGLLSAYASASQEALDDQLERAEYGLIDDEEALLAARRKANEAYQKWLYSVGQSQSAASLVADAGKAVRRVVLALGLASAGFACFTGEALVGEPCADDSDCGPKLACNEDGLCDEFHCPGALSIEVDNFAPDVMVLVDYAISMNKDVEGTGLSRWDFAYEVVRRISEETGPHVNLGVLRIPTTESGNRPCVTSPEGLVAPGADQGAAVLATQVDIIRSERVAQKVVRG